ncbi:MAG: hypothetical protein ABGX22_25500 [Pirellulaceae bacterium]
MALNPCPRCGGEARGWQCWRSVHIFLMLNLGLFAGLVLVSGVFYFIAAVADV